MKIYTKTGDAGDTGLYGGQRVHKDDGRVEAYGTIDELNSVLGIARASITNPRIDSLLARLQNELFDLGAELATPPDRIGTKLGQQLSKIDDRHVRSMEQEIDTCEEELAPLKTFIVPGGTLQAAHLHLARAVCRRAERRVVKLGHVDVVRPEAIRYLNRLSDLLFVLARYSNSSAGVADVPWRHSNEPSQ